MSADMSADMDPDADRADNGPEQPRLEASCCTSREELPGIRAECSIATVFI
jgi:hypothetical protein